MTRWPVLAAAAAVIVGGVAVVVAWLVGMADRLDQERRG